VEFAEGLGLGTNQAGGAGAHEQGAITGEGIEALSVSNHPGNLLAAPQTNAEGIALTSSSSYSNLPVKVIAALPGEVGPSLSASNSSDAAALAGRLQQAGAKTGDIQFSLMWRDINDIDLHCIDPKGEEIWFNHTRSASGGRLDVDANAGPPYTTVPVENIFWPAGGAPRGTYTIDIRFYARHDHGNIPVWCTIRTIVRSATNYYRHAVSFPGQRDRICTVTY